MSQDALATALAALWTKNRDTVLGRARAVHTTLLDAAAGRPADLSEAAREAHVLAGALGTYGRPGSALFAEVERVLDGGEAEPEADLASLAARVGRAIAEL